MVTAVLEGLCGGVAERIVVEPRERVGGGTVLCERQKKRPEGVCEI
jgi:hypothetical protein